MSFFDFFSKILFSDLKKIVVLAKKKILEGDDLPSLPNHLHPNCSPIDENLVSIANARKLIFSLCIASKQLLIPCFGLYLVYVLSNLVKPILINKFIHAADVAIKSGVVTGGVVLAVVFGIASVIGSLCIQHYYFRSLQLNQIFTNVLNKKIYLHSLFLTQDARMRKPLGDIVNHMSSDSDAVSDFGMISFELLNVVLMITGITALLFYYMGITAFVSIGAILLMTPVTKWVAKRFTHLDDELMKKRDTRGTLMSQALNGIRVVKYFAWEKSIHDEVSVIRNEELASRKKLAQAESIAMLSYSAVSTIVLFLSLGVHVFRGGTLDAALVFTCVSLFAQIEEPFGQLSIVISRMANSFVGASRICSFLAESRLPENRSVESQENAVALHVENLSVRHQGMQNPAISNVNIFLKAGESIAIVGAVGAGKSSFLQALLRELPFSSGTLRFLNQKNTDIIPRLAYVPQEAFILNGTLKENIYFGETPDESLLLDAIHASCLDSDLLELPAGLGTEIGEKGVNLSGGQKQRVSLARAIYHRPNFILLDDPLSAVDVKTEELLIERLLFGAWKNITRVVVTHRLSHLELFDKVAFFKDGKLLACDSLALLLKKSEEFSSFYAEHSKVENDVALYGAQPTREKGALVADESRVTEDEDRAIGAVKSSVYMDYIRALSGSRMSILLLLALGTISGAAFPMIQRSWLAFVSNPKGQYFSTYPKMAVLIYGALGFLTLGIGLANRLFWLERGIAAGKDLHNAMLNSILKAPLRFFDSTPVGRILQRFSRDTESVDIQLQWSFETTIRCVVNILAAFLLILGVMPLMIFVFIPMFYFYYKLQLNYRIPAREAKRLDSISRSPRYAHFKETLQGLPVIRSFRKTDFFIELFVEKLAHSQRMFYGHYMLNRWFSARIPILGAFISTCTAIGIMFYAKNGQISAGVAGLVIIYTLSFWESLNWAVRIFSEVEARMTAVERMRFYSNLEAEVDVFSPTSEILPKEWPMSGEIVFENVEARYAKHLPPVLKGVSFRVAAGSRVGIIGRTGSGKSTLLQTLFRCMEIDGGEIRIDGFNIASVPLERLRKSLAIIPQDPTLFMGSIRSNLDRYGEHSDAEIWTALENARLKEFISFLPNGLQTSIEENGVNLSQGQRQLLCLARALLCGARVVVMDEATASVDVQTDGMVQQVVRESCKNITMLIIAHRLGTVADCDQVIEIRAGKVHRKLDLEKTHPEISH